MLSTSKVCHRVTLLTSLGFRVYGNVCYRVTLLTIVSSSQDASAMISHVPQVSVSVSAQTQKVCFISADLGHTTDIEEVHTITTVQGMNPGSGEMEVIEEGVDGVVGSKE